MAVLVNNRKRKLLRAGILAAALCLVLLVSQLLTLADGARYTPYMKPGDQTGFTALPDPIRDAADPAGFTDYTLDIPGFEKMAENQWLCLFVNQAEQQIRVADKRTGYVWSSSPAEAVLQNGGIAESVREDMASLLVFSYVNLTTNGLETETNSLREEHTLELERIYGGVRLTFDFPRLNIGLALELVLNDTYFVAGVPSDRIQENEEGGEVEEAQDNLLQAIDEVETQCKELEALSEKEADMSDSLLSLVRVSADTVLENLLYVSQQVGTSEISLNRLQTARESIEVLQSIFFDREAMMELLGTMITSVQRVEELAAGMDNQISNGLISLKVMPYFGAQTSETDGYAFYPDGNGAISYFNRPRSTTVGSYQEDVYDIYQQTVPLSATQRVEENRGTPSVLAVCGIKAENSAFAAIITEGQYDCAIGYKPAQPDLDCANVYTQFYLRKRTTLVNSTGGKSQMYDNIRTRCDWQLAYRMLAGEDADYSGMAVAYRDYLEQTGRLSRSALMDGAMPIGLEFYMGQQSGGNGLLSRYVTETRYGYIQDYLTQLEEGGASRLLLAVNGWTQHNGTRFPDVLEPASQTGGVEGLQKLADYMTKQGHVLALSANVVGGRRTDLNSTVLDRATMKNKSLLTVEYYGYHIFNAGYVYNSVTGDLFGQMARLGATGVVYGDLGNSLYFDYNTTSPTDRMQTAYTFKNLAQRTRESLGTVAGSNVNDYMYGTTDWNMDVPMEDKGYLFSDENVPFLQMVLHGSVVYTGHGDNYWHDRNAQLLQAVEYGYVPYYFLTEENSTVIRNTLGVDIYGTTAAEWQETLLADYRRMREGVGAVWNVKMQRHVRLDNTLAVTIYENGARVYVNYGDEARTVDGVMVEAGDFAVQA